MQVAGTREGGVRYLKIPYLTLPYDQGKFYPKINYEYDQPSFSLHAH